MAEFVSPWEFIKPYMDSPVPNLNAGITTGMNVAHMANQIPNLNADTAYKKASIPLIATHMKLMEAQAAKEQQEADQAKNIWNLFSGSQQSTPAQSVDQAIAPPPLPQALPAPLDYTRTKNTAITPAVAQNTVGNIGKMPELLGRGTVPDPQGTPPILPKAGAQQSPSLANIEQIIKDPMKSAAFHKFFGVSPYEYYNQIKMHDATEALGPDASPEDILKALSPYHPSYASAYEAILNKKATQSETKRWHDMEQKDREAQLGIARAHLAATIGKEKAATFAPMVVKDADGNEIPILYNTKNPQEHYKVSDLMPGTVSMEKPGTKKEVDPQTATTMKSLGLNPDGTPIKKKTAAPSAPKAGDVVDGYKFNGGNPADKNNWIKVS